MVNKSIITFWCKNVTWEVTIMPQNVIKDKNLYKTECITKVLGHNWVTNGSYHKRNKATVSKLGTF